MPCYSNVERRSSRCYISLSDWQIDYKGVLYSNWHAFCLLSLNNLRIFSLIDIVEPFLPIGFQNTLQIVSVVRALQDIVINRKKYSENMKKIFRKIQKGTTKMFRRIKALGGMENEAEMCSSTLWDNHPLPPKITTLYISLRKLPLADFFIYRRLEQRFLCYFLCPPSCSLKESRRLSPPTSQKRV